MLKRTLVLIDSRHGLKDVDREVMEMLDEAAVGYHLVLTKADKIKPTELGATLEAIAGRGAQASGRASRLIFATSSETGDGHRRVKDCDPGGGDL